MGSAPAVGRTDLTPQQIERRKSGIGGSDAKRIMSGDALGLWEEKTGRKEPEDLTWNLAVQLGKWTEGLNALFFERESKLVLNFCAAVKEKTWVHPAYAWMLCHVDGLCKGGVWEAKHVNAFEPEDTPRKRHYAQLQHNMEVLNAEVAYLSVIYGNSKWAYFAVPRDPDYIGQLLEREAAFMECLRTDTPPAVADMAKLEPPKPAGERSVVDLTGNNMFGECAAIWLENREAAAAFKAAESGLKGLVEDGVGFAYGAASSMSKVKGKLRTVETTLCLSRAKDGKLSLREPKKADWEKIGEHKEELARAAKRENQGSR